MSDLLDLVMPALGQSVAEGTVVQWLKKPGDAVARDEAVAVISTDKAEAEVPAPAAGVLAEILVPAGKTVEVGTLLGRMRAGAAAAGSASAAGSPTAPAAPAPKASAPVAVIAPASGTLPSGRGEGTSFLSPAVRSLARARGISFDDVRAIAGSGRNGRVTLGDLAAWIEKRPTPASVAFPAASPAAMPDRAASRPETEADIEVIPMVGMRAKIAEHMLASKRNAPHVDTVAEVDVSGVVAARRELGPAFEKQHGFGLSFNAFFLRAAATALLEFPYVNAILDERGIVQHRRVHLGMAVALEPSGLVVPVIRDAHELSVRGMAIEAQRLAVRARARQLAPEEMHGGTFTVTNPGVFGNSFGMPIIHQPQAAILDFGAIKKRVVVVQDAQGNDVIAIRPQCFAVLAWDHRIMDGATAAKFLQRVVREIEAFSPARGID